ncbi:MAG: ArsA family ATPase [Oligoflexales bacterium]|nr:ArsA family ATPase [Oligoflexales bacterium]
MKVGQHMVGLQEFFKYKLVFISGKGGVGKSVVTASLAVCAAKLGKKVLLVENASKEQLPPLFYYNEPVGHHEVPILENLYCINLNSKECFKEYVVEHLGMANLYKKVFDRKLMKSFLDAIPGLNETMLLGRLYHTCMLRKPPRDYDLVIFDSPASGHFFNLLNTPAAVLGSGLGGPLIREVTKVNNFLQDPELCASFLVSIPEELVSSETLEFIPKIIKESPVRLGGVFLNRSYSQPIKDKLNLLMKEERYPSLAEVKDYLRNKISRALKEQSKFLEGLGSLGLSDRCVMLPELGFVTEPLTDELATRILREVSL